MAKALPDGATLAPWTIHDLRRTAATEMGRLGFSRFVIGRILNHADASITAIYDRHGYLDEKRSALEAWENYVLRVTVVGADANVSAIRAAS